MKTISKSLIAATALVFLAFWQPAQAQFINYNHDVVYTFRKVGIGTRDPGRALHVKASLGEAIEFESSSPVGTRMRFKPTAAQGHIWDIGATAYGATGEDGGGRFMIRNGTKSKTHFVIDSMGRVGIGIMSPVYKLDVCGTIRSKEVMVQSGWCDYVFEPSYPLPTLEEEAQHIAQKGHLLGFESEAAMNGTIELSDVSKRQQAKIEEMMLHLIEMNQEIQQLKKENQALKTIVHQLNTK